MEATRTLTASCSYRFNQQWSQQIIFCLNMPIIKSFLTLRKPVGRLQNSRLLQHLIPLRIHELAQKDKTEAILSEKRRYFRSSIKLKLIKSLIDNECKLRSKRPCNRSSKLKACFIYDRSSSNENASLTSIILAGTQGHPKQLNEHRRFFANFTTIILQCQQHKWWCKQIKTCNTSRGEASAKTSQGA